MKTYIALLRGINVSGKKKVLMAELRILLEGANFENVKTYIQSGNVVFQSSIKERETIEYLIFEAIKKHFGFEVPILIIDSFILQEILKSCPFAEEKKEKSYFTLLKTVPEVQLSKALSLINIENEEVIVTNQCVYFYSSKGYSHSKCNNNFIEKRLKVNATTRNYKTMMKLIEMVNA